MRRFTILSLMLLVVGLAVGIAALRNANDHWAGSLLLATPLLLCTALVGGLCGREAARARRLGFAVFGGRYLALAFLGLSEPNLAKLPTSRLLIYVHQQALPPQTGTWLFTGTMPGQVGQGSIFVSNINGTMIRQPLTSTSGGQAAAPNRWSRLLPGAANLEAFSAVGHCLFALLAGLLGGVIAWRFEKGRITGQEAA